MRAWLGAKLDHRSWFAAALALIAAAFLTLAVGTAISRAPWCDEAWFASSARNLLMKGHLGVSFIQENGTWTTPMKGIGRLCYWQPPLYFLTQAAWYTVFGFGLFQMRALSVMWGIAGLASWFVIVRKLSGSRKAALLTAAMIAIDKHYISSATDGRMDMMTAALCSVGMAAYLGLRERNLTLAVLAGNAFVVCGWLTHVNGVLGFIGLTALALYLDHGRLGLRQVVLGAAPYLAGGLAWAMYIAQEPSAFAAQFLGNIANAGRFRGPVSFLINFGREISERYATAYGLARSGYLLQRSKTVVLATYVIGVLGAALIRDLRRERGVGALLILAGTYFLSMALVLGNKTPAYMVHIVPIYAACLAMFARHFWRQPAATGAWLVVVAIAAACVVQIGGSAHIVASRTRSADFAPVVRFVEAVSDQQTLIMASAELAWGIGFDANIDDDPRLGYYTGVVPDIIVVGDRYREVLRELRIAQPDAYRHVATLLGRRFRKVYDHGTYEVYTRR